MPIELTRVELISVFALLFVFHMEVECVHICTLIYLFILVPLNFGTKGCLQLAMLAHKLAHKRVKVTSVNTVRCNLGCRAFKSRPV